MLVLKYGFYFSLFISSSFTFDPALISPPIIYTSGCISYAQITQAVQITFCEKHWLDNLGKLCNNKEIQPVSPCSFFLLPYEPLASTSSTKGFFFARTSALSFSSSSRPCSVDNEDRGSCFTLDRKSLMISCPSYNRKIEQSIQ